MGTKRTPVTDLVEPPFWNDRELTRREKAIRGAVCIDTDGYIGINVVKSKRETLTYTLRCHFVGVVPLLPQWLQREYGGSIAISNGSMHRRHSWTAAGRIGYRFLLEIRPFIVVKAAQSDLMLEMGRWLYVDHQKDGWQEKSEFCRPYWIRIREINQSQGELNHPKK